MILALLLQAATPPALPPAPPAAPRMPAATVMAEPLALAVAGWDADGDGRTTRAEIDAGVRRSFAGVDPRGSGGIGYIAFADWAERWLGDRAALPSPFDVDADSDNRITLAELQAQFARTVERLDRDRDGALTRAELLTIRTGLSDVPPGKRGRPRR